MDRQAAPAAMGSMQRSLLLRFPVWLAIVCACATVLGPAGRVLCVNASGHVAIETASADCCRDARASTGELSPADHCDCVDIPLIESAVRSSVGTERLWTTWTTQPVTFLQPALVQAGTIVSPVRFLVLDPFVPSLVLASLRSVVLLA
jgi:hypothetical protein